ncbi:MAG: hypothetical protein V3V25_08605 [Paracoccaceae bacterium]
MSKPKLTLFFIVEPPLYQKLACYLAASIKEQFDEPINLIGYCPTHKVDELDPKAVGVLEKLGVEIRSFDVDGVFDPPYPHGNKLLACLEKRDTPHSGFVDSDVLFIRKNKIENILSPGKVSLTPAASIYWAPRKLWPTIYSEFGMEVPSERIYLTRQNGRPKVPYFSSGFFTFPEEPLKGVEKRFPEIWMDVGQTVDAIAELEDKRPYLDQMSLPVAIEKAGLEYNLMPEEQHWILGGSMRRKPFPTDRKIYTVHYRKWNILAENGLSGLGKEILFKQAGVKKVAHFAL